MFDKTAMITGLKQQVNDELRAKVLIEVLKQTESDDEIIDVCQAYKNYLLSDVVKASPSEASRIKSIERHMTAPRNAIKKALGEGHLSLKHLVLSSKEAAIRDTYNEAREDKKSDSPGVIDASAILKIASELMASPSNSAEIALGIQLVTGRRIVEVYLGEFEIEDSFTMLFNGQRKKRENIDAATSDYLIPVLMDSQTIKDAHEKLLDLHEPVRYLVKENPEKAFNNSTEYRRRLNPICKLRIDSILPAVAVRQVTHKSRSFYARCIEEFAKPQHSKAGTVSRIVTKALGDLPGMAETYGHYEIKNLPNIEFQVDKRSVGIVSNTSIKIISEESTGMSVNLESVIEKMTNKKAAESLLSAIKSGFDPAVLIAKALDTAQKADETYGKKKSATDKLNEIFNAIVANNDGTEDIERKLEVTASVLSQINKEVYGSDVPSVTSKAFLASVKPAIDTHYKKTGITEGHNLKVLRSLKVIPELITAISSDMLMAQSLN